LPAPLEKALQERGGFIGENAGDNLDLVVESRIDTQVVERSTGSGFGVTCGKDQTANPGEYERTRTHGTRFESNVDFGSWKIPVAKLLHRLLQGEQFGMSQGTFGSDGQVVCLSNYLPVHEDNRTDGHLIEAFCVCSEL
jgi:hypothetical protein